MKYLSSQPFTGRPNTREFEDNYDEALPRGTRRPKCPKRGCHIIGTTDECPDCKDTIDSSDQFPEVA